MDKVDRRRLVVAVDLVRAAVLGLVASGRSMHDLDLAELYVGGVPDRVGRDRGRRSVPGFDSAHRASRERAGANGNVIGAQTFGLGFAGPLSGDSCSRSRPRFLSPATHSPTCARRRCCDERYPITPNPVRASAVRVVADIRWAFGTSVTDPMLRS